MCEKKRSNCLPFDWVQMISTCYQSHWNRVLRVLYIQCEIDLYVYEVSTFFKNVFSLYFSLSVSFLFSRSVCVCVCLFDLIPN